MRAVHFSFSPEATLHRRHCLLSFVSAVLFFAASAVFAQSMTVSTVVGSTAGGGYLDGNGTNARFSYPRGVAVDSTGIVYVSDTGNHVIRRITPSGDVSTLAGLAGTQGSADGTGSAARFNFPYGLAIDLNDNVIVADSSNHTIRRITPAGVVTTIAGSAGKSGTTDGDGAAARFQSPAGVAVDQSGFIYVADTNNHTIRRIAGPNSTVTTFTGVPGQSGYDDGYPGSEIPAKFIYPFDIAVDANGDLYVADTYAHEIRKVTREKVVTTIAGDGFDPDSVDGAGTVARFQYPESIDVAPNGDIWIADTVNDQIRKMTPQGVVTTMAGVPNAVGVRNGALAQARFTRPTGLVFDRSGNLYIADHGNMVVRKVSTSLNVTTLAGNTPVSGGTDGFVSDARFFLPDQLAFDHLGNVFLTDSANTIRKIDVDGNVTTFAGTRNQTGSADGTGSAARFFYPQGLAVDTANNVWVADTGNNTIRKITPAGQVTTVAGVAGASGKSDGAGTQARFNQPWSLAFDDRGYLYIADGANNLIRLLDPSGVVTTYAGTGADGSSNGSALSSTFSFPIAIAVDPARNLYIADWGNNVVRKITSSGTVSTFAGRAGSSGSADGTGTNAFFDHPAGVTVAPDGSIFVADQDNHTIRRITSTGVVTTPAGRVDGPGNVDGSGRDARLYLPASLTADSTGRIWISDWYNHAIKIASFAPPTVPSFTATPSLIANPGSVTLSWSTTNATSVVITPNLGADVGSVPTNGTKVVNVTQTTRYTLVATGPGGTASAIVTVYVGSGPPRRRPSH